MVIVYLTKVGTRGRSVGCRNGFAGPLLPLGPWRRLSFGGGLRNVYIVCLGISTTASHGGSCCPW